jgi:hypothetical protein
VRNDLSPGNDDIKSGEQCTQRDHEKDTSQLLFMNSVGQEKRSDYDSRYNNNRDEVWEKWFRFPRYVVLFYYILKKGRYGNSLENYRFK